MTSSARAVRIKVRAAAESEPRTRPSPASIHASVVSKTLSTMDDVGSVASAGVALEVSDGSFTSVLMVVILSWQSRIVAFEVKPGVSKTLNLKCSSRAEPDGTTSRCPAERGPGTMYFSEFLDRLAERSSMDRFGDSRRAPRGSLT